jgi:hypothetical protein
MGFVNEKLEGDKQSISEQQAELAKPFGASWASGDSLTIDRERNMWLFHITPGSAIWGGYTRYGFHWRDEYINLWATGGTSEQIAEQLRLDEEANKQGFKKKNSEIYIKRIKMSSKQEIHEEKMLQLETYKEMLADLQEAFRVRKFQWVDLDTEVILTLIDETEVGK